MVKLIGAIFTLLMEVLVCIILTQSLKAISKKKMVWPSFHEFIAAKKLYYLAGPTHLRVSALTS